MPRSATVGLAFALSALGGCSPAGNEGGSGGQAGAGQSSGGVTAAGGGSGAQGGSGGVTGGATGGSVVPMGGNTTGGSVTMGGSAGTGGSSGMAGGAASPCGTGSIFCTDFEAETISDKLVFFPEYLRATQTFVSLDTTMFHGGKRALKVTGTDYSQMLGVAVPSQFWGRVYVRSDTDIQEGHNTYVAAGTGTGDPNDGTYIRIGEHECQLELNRNTDDKELLSNGGMYMCSGGVKLLKDTWYCLEFYYGPTETRVFVDNTEVTALHTTDWGPNDYKIFKLGFEKYHGGPKTLWYDDLALASEQLHCL